MNYDLLHSTTRNPVVLVHGIDDTDLIFWRMAPTLKNLGWAVYSVNLTPNNGECGLDELAHQVKAFIDRTFAPDQPIDLLGFSMGGIISRYYVQRLGGIDRVQRFVTLSSPHQGTWAAYSRLNPGCTQMRPDSLFLTDLNADVDRLDQINFTSIWTPLDLIIVPASSSQLPVGIDRQIWVAGHAWMVTDPKSILAVAEALAEPLRSQSEASDRSSEVYPSLWKRLARTAKLPSLPLLPALPTLAKSLTKGKR